MDSEDSSEWLPPPGQSLFEDFESQFSVVFADSDELKQVAYSIRHHVYGEDLGSESPMLPDNAADKYDSFAYHLLLLHRPSGLYAGTIRLITPRQISQQLPVQSLGLRKYWLTDVAEKQPNQSCISEVSKLAVAAEFSKRESDKDPLSQTLNAIEDQAFAIGAHRDFPKITMGLCLASVSLARQLFHDHIYAVMPPVLYHKLHGYGLLFEQVSQVFERRGAKAVYRLNLDQGVRIARSIYAMNDHITNQLATQLHLLPIVNEAAGE